VYTRVWDRATGARAAARSDSAGRVRPAVTALAVHSMGQGRQATEWRVWLAKQH